MIDIEAIEKAVQSVLVPPNELAYPGVPGIELNCDLYELLGTHVPALIARIRELEKELKATKCIGWDSGGFLSYDD